MGVDIPGGGLDAFGGGNMSDLTYRFIGNESKFSLAEFNITEILDTSGVVTDFLVSGRIGESLDMVSSNNNIAQPESLPIYPNPTSTHFWLNPNGSSSATVASEVKLYNASGQCVMTKQKHPIHQPIEV